MFNKGEFSEVNTEFESQYSKAGWAGGAVVTHCPVGAEQVGCQGLGERQADIIK